MVAKVGRKVVLTDAGTVLAEHAEAIPGPGESSRQVTARGKRQLVLGQSEPPGRLNREPARRRVVRVDARLILMLRVVRCRMRLAAVMGRKFLMRIFRFSSFPPENKLPKFPFRLSRCPKL